MTNFLILSKRLSFDGAKPWLTDELVHALVEEHENVDVLLFDLSGEWKLGKTFWEGASVYAFPVAKKGKIYRAISIFLNYIMIFFFANWLRFRRKYDVVVGFSVSSFFVFVPRMVRRSCSSINVLFLWDFFPFHHMQIGRIGNKLLFWFAKIMEQISINEYDVVALMSKKNVDAFSSLYPKYRGRLDIVPVWGKFDENDEPDNEKKFGCFELNIVFGGQITRGRGIEQIVELAKRIRSAKMDACIHVFGDGSFSHLIENEAKNNRHIHYWGSVSRKEYNSYLKSADAGLVVTVAGVTYPTFPSKVIDYFSCGKPVIACVEEYTDFGTFIQDEVGAGISVNAGDFDGLYNAVFECISLKKKGKLSAMGDRGHQYYIAHMEVSNTVAWLKELVRKKL